MTRTVQLSIIIAAVAVGVLIGASLFRSRSEEPVRAAQTAPPESRPMEADRLTSELARANDRLAALETQLRSLQDKVDTRAKDKETLLKDLKVELAGKSRILVEEEFADKDEMPFGWRVPHRPQSVAGLLGLDAARRKTLEETYQSFVDRIRALEKQHATTSVDGDTTRIDIAPFPAEGKALIDEWSARLTALLTPEEKDKYKRLSLGLLPADVGQNERVIAIVDEGNGMATSTEQTAAATGSSGYYKGPKDMAMAPYRHLLRK